ncbi:transforming growth factor, beta receptor associated protein 1 [Rhizophlyctis rosea]|nr:transforming growth factor, beta receptor associated protein 1 [Rhizophlyctis rosea]
MVRYESDICAADGQQYKIIHLDDGETIPLFPYDRNVMRPVIAAMIKGEFLLGTATPQGGGLGMFISSDGNPIRGTLEWPAIPRSIAFQFPYIIALLRNNVIEVHNLFTQKRVQKIMIPASVEPRFLIEASFDLQSTDLETGHACSVKVAVACKEAVLGLRMISLEGQIDLLLERKSIDRAVALAEQMMQGMPDEDGEKKRATLRSLYQRAGLVYFRDTLFDEALDLFKKSQLDPLLLIALYPEFGTSGEANTPSGGHWLTEMGTIDDIVRVSLQRNYPDADPETISSFGAALVATAREMLEKYLLFARENKAGIGRLEEIDTVLLRIYAENNPTAMYRLLSGPNYCQLEESEKYLLGKKKYYALSLLYRHHNLMKKVLDMWIKIASNEVEDPDFPGIALIVTFLSETEDKELVWRYADWVSKKDVGLGVQIFIDWKGPPLDPDDVLEYLKPFGTAGKRYLEHLVKKLGNKDEKRHTALCLLYVDEVLQYAGQDGFDAIESAYTSLDPRPLFLTFLRSRPDDPLSRARAQLLEYLETSEWYSVRGVGAKVEDVERLYAERAVLQGEMGNHEAVLRLLVENVGDHVGAERYCVRAPAVPRVVRRGSGTGRGGVASVRSSGAGWAEGEQDALRRSLIFMLLRLYMGVKHPDVNVTHVIRILNTYAGDLDVLQVMKLLPDHWSLEMTSRFLASAMRQSLHGYREGQVVRALARGEHFKVNANLIESYQSYPPIHMPPEGAACAVCGKVVKDPTVFAKLPDAEGLIAHLHCISD